MKLNAQHFVIDKLIFDNILFEDLNARELYTTKVDSKNGSVDLLLPLLKSNFHGKRMTANDEICFNLLSSYAYLKKNQIYEALRFQVFNSKSLSKVNNEKLALANKLLAALIYEKQGAYNLACNELYELRSPDLSENYQLEYYLACLKLKDESTKDAHSNFELALQNSKKVSLIDQFYCLINLSKTSGELGKFKEALAYALQADTLLDNRDRELFNPNIQYTGSYDSRSDVRESLKNQSLVNLSVAYRKTKRYADALRVLNSLIDTEKNNKSNGTLIEVYINKALTYTLLRDYNNAASSYYEALKLEEVGKDKSKKSEIYNLLAKNSYLSQDYIKAVDFCETSIEISRRNFDYTNLAASYYILSETYARNSDYASSQKYFKLYNDTKEILEKQKQDLYSVSKSRNTETRLLAKKAESDILEDEKQQLEGINTKMIQEQKEKEFLLLKKDNELKEKDLVNQRLEKEQIQRNLILIKEQLEKEQLQKRNIELNREREIETLESKNNENEIKLLNTQKEVYVRENKLKTSELEASRSRTKLLLSAFAILLVFISSLIYFLYKTNKQKGTIERFNQTIQKTNLELEQNINRVTEQKEIIEKKNNQILDSISYAQRIQQSLLLPEKKFRSYFEESFVLYLPKEIVSGDFYLAKKKGDEIIVAVVDCTGHGVPGAMIAALAYQEIMHITDTMESDPATMLNALNVRMTFMLNANQLIGSDGMDLVLICINTVARTMRYAGAKSSFSLSNNGKLTEFKTDKKSIGQDLKEENFSFQTNKLSYNVGDQLYLYTDGFADQFSEADKKRIGSKRFKNKLEQISQLPPDTQKREMESFLNSHRGSALQTDDITLLAIKLI